MVVLFLRFTGPTCNSNFTIRKGVCRWTCMWYLSSDSSLGLKFDRTHEISLKYDFSSFFLNRGFKLKTLN